MGGRAGAHDSNILRNTGRKIPGNILRRFQGAGPKIGRCAKAGCAGKLGLDRLLRARYYPGMRISARNRLVGKIEELQIGDLMAHVVVKVGEHVVESVISRRSVEEMNLQVGDTVAVVVQSTDVMLQKA